MHKIDTSFSTRKKAVEKARNARFWRRIAFICLAVISVGAISAYVFLTMRDHSQQAASRTPDEAAEAEALAAYAPDIIDLAGEPLTIELPDEAKASTKVRWYPSPAELKKFGVSGAIAILHEQILPTGTQIMLKVPSTQRDFAFFEAQKTTKPTRITDHPVKADQADDDAKTDTKVDTPAAATQTSPDKADAADTDATTDEWGELNGADVPADNAAWKPGTVEDNVSTEYLVPEASRQTATTDTILQVSSDVQILDFLLKSDVNPVIAKFANDAIAAQFAVSSLPAGSVVALRFTQPPGASSARPRLVQIALYSPGHYIGALAATQDGTFLPSVDPWADKNLSAVKKPDAGPQLQQKFRLIDGVYSAAIRNGIGTRIAGEVVMQLARSYDLAEYANESDWITIVYSAAPRETDGNRTNILYVGITRSDSAIKCYVTLLAENSRYGCFNEDATSEATTAQNGMVIPVAGVMTSPFGPRMHPILKKILVHKGVDWAAPIGTPVRAAYSGVVVFAGDKGTFGNFIRLDHGSGLATSYAHLSAFAKDLAVGTKVKAGDLIGYVGTSGRSTGPHLHFEAYRNDAVVDPLQMNVTEVGDAKAIKDLLNRIIRVESGGNASAKNPKSTATGLGQFIDSTWMRMISSYRPELMSSLSRAQILDLRTDPTIATEMLGNLARENEDYLKSRGHQITPARLYLAHFLGPAGADLILSSPDDAQVAPLVGPQVMKANPHLIGMTVAGINAWTERVMGVRGGKSQDADVPPPKVPIALPADYVEYKGYVEALVKVALGGTAL